MAKSRGSKRYHSNRKHRRICTPALKICGLSCPCDIEWVNDAGVDFRVSAFTRSRRQVSPEQAKQSRQHVKKEIPAVGVFVNETIETIVGLVEMASLTGAPAPGRKRGIK